MNKTPEAYKKAISAMFKNAETNEMGQEQLVNTYILPLLVGEMNSATREKLHCVSPRFMDFMAEWGQICYEMDRYERKGHHTADVLMLIALQRIIHGAIYYNSMDKSVFGLPQSYSNYMIWCDRAVPMDWYCWKFLQANLEFCLTQKQNKAICKLANIILHSLLSDLHSDNTIVKTDDYHWDEKQTDVTVKEVYEWAEKLAIKVYGVNRTAMIVAPVWRKKMDFFNTNRDRINWRMVWPYFELNDEPYFKPWQKFFLKLVGLYKPLVKWKIKREIAAYQKPQ